MTSEKEGVVPLTEEPLRGLRVTGETALQSERPDTEMVGLFLGIIRSLAVLHLMAVMGHFLLTKISV